MSKTAKVKMKINPPTLNLQKNQKGIYTIEIEKNTKIKLSNKPEKTTLIFEENPKRGILLDIIT
jgi:predicted secreted protein